MLNPEVSL